MMCEAYKRGEPVRVIAERFGVQNPAVYKALRRGGVLPPYQPRKHGGKGRPVGGGVKGYTEQRLKRSADAIARKEAKLPPLPTQQIVDRDPCFFCGARGDVCQCKKGGR